MVCCLTQYMWKQSVVYMWRACWPGRVNRYLFTSCWDWKLEVGPRDIEQVDGKECRKL